MIYYDYSSFKRDTCELIGKIIPFSPDTIVVITRGGLMLTHAISQGLNIRNIQSVRTKFYDKDIRRDKISVHVNCNLISSIRVLIVDDIADSGITLKHVKQKLSQLYPKCNFKIATLFYKKDSIIQPDFTINEATDWINFFWEDDFKESL